MRTFSRYAVNITLAASLAACGGSQPPIGATDAMPPAAPTRMHRAASAPYKLLYKFNPAQNGENPSGSLLDVGGTLYGTTSAGGGTGCGGYGCGTAYSITTSGVHKLLYSFAGGSDGAKPKGLVDVNGTLYGTTAYAGNSGCLYAQGCGTVYSISTSGSEKVLYAFKGGADGGNPSGGLINVNGTLFGATAFGGGTGCYANVGCGTVYSITTSGQETVLHAFGDRSDDGAMPYGELLNVHGVLYGTTTIGGSTRCRDSSDEMFFCGTIYKISTSGNEKVVYAFKGHTDGASPYAGLIDVKGTLYGTTYYGGGSGCYNVGCGTVFQISPSGSGYSILYDFQGNPDGEGPMSGLTAVQGTLYGVTVTGGYRRNRCETGSGCGTIYSISTSGTETVLYHFLGTHNGALPSGALTDVSGTLYGATAIGGMDGKCCRPYGYGTVFRLSL